MAESATEASKNSSAVLATRGFNTRRAEILCKHFDETLPADTISKYTKPDVISTAFSGDSDYICRRNLADWPDYDKKNLTFYFLPSKPPAKGKSHLVQERAISSSKAPSSQAHDVDSSARVQTVQGHLLLCPPSGRITAFTNIQVTFPLVPSAEMRVASLNGEVSHPWPADTPITSMDRRVCEEDPVKYGIDVFKTGPLPTSQVGPPTDLPTQTSVANSAAGEPATGEYDMTVLDDNPFYQKVIAELSDLD